MRKDSSLNGLNLTKTPVHYITLHRLEIFAYLDLNLGQTETRNCESVHTLEFVQGIVESWSKGNRNFTIFVVTGGSHHFL